jgi:sarcosine oxidase subunit gamma
MVERKSPPAVTPGRSGAAEIRVRLGQIPLELWQIAFWPDAAGAVAARLAETFGATPAPGRVAVAGDLRLIRAEPLTWWIIGGAPPCQVSAEEGATLDLSHGRVMIRIEGPDAAALLARFVSVDLRDHAFPDGAHAATGAHHSQWSLIRRDAGGPGYDLLVGRSFARDVWEMLELHARQFGLEIF